MKTEEWLQLARVLAQRPDFIATASVSRVAAGRIVGPEPYMQIRAHDLAQHLAAGKSFAEYERLERQRAEDAKRIERSVYWPFYAIGIAALGVAVYFSMFKEPEEPTCIEKYGAPAIRDPETGEVVGMTGCRP